MWSSEIKEYMKDEKEFIGCYPFDKLHTIRKRRSFSLVINTGSSDTMGEHWLAVKVIKQKCFYFDSFGLPIINEEIKNFLKDYGKSYYSRVCIQDIESNKCGYFCIMFLKSVNDYNDYVNFINQFE